MALDSAHIRTANAAETRSPRLPATIEWPTMAVATAIYLGFGLVTVFHEALPTALVIALGAYLIAWHGSLQHEVLHGHPTPWPWFNRALVALPLSLWLPYDRYRDAHLAHHADENLTDPVLDPESYYLPAERWARRDWVAIAMGWIHNTVLGRLTLGPAIAMYRFMREELSQARIAPGAALRVWAIHLSGVAAVMTWVVVVCGIEAWWYVVAMAYPGTSLSLLRSFLEHQARPAIGERTVIIDAEAPLSLLFLNNNLHVIHHAVPGAPWYRLPALYRADRERWLARNGGYHYRGYWEVICRFLLWPKEAPVHPGWTLRENVGQLYPAANTPLADDQRIA